MFSGRTVTPTQLVTSSAIYLLLVLNTPFLQALANAVQATDMTDYAFTAAVAVVLLCAHVLVLTVFTVPYVLKPLLVVLIIAFGAYFARFIGTVVTLALPRSREPRDRSGQEAGPARRRRDDAEAPDRRGPAHL